MKVAHFCVTYTELLMSPGFFERALSRPHPKKTHRKPKYDFDFVISDVTARVAAHESSLEKMAETMRENASANRSYSVLATFSGDKVGGCEFRYSHSLAHEVLAQWVSWS